MPIYQVYSRNTHLHVWIDTLNIKQSCKEDGHVLYKVTSEGGGHVLHEMACEEDGTCWTRSHEMACVGN